MPAKLEIIGNALVISDTDSGDELLDVPSADVYYHIDEYSGEFVIRTRNKPRKVEFELVRYRLSNVVDENGNLFTEASIRSWCRENLTTPSTDPIEVNENGIGAFTVS